METAYIIKIGGNRQAAAKAALSYMGPGKAFKKGDRVVLKPNLVCPISEAKGTTTSLWLLESLIKELKKYGAKPIIAESAGYEFDTDKTFKILGLDKLSKRTGVELVNLDGCKTRRVATGGNVLKALEVPEVILDSEHIINLPIIKTHKLTTVTFGMKNLMGIPPRKERRRAHILGVHQAIVDIWKAIPPSLTIADGTRVMYRGGPAFGDGKDLGILIAGKNTLAVDLACCKVAGLEPGDVAHIRLALAQNPAEYGVEYVGKGSFEGVPFEKKKPLAYRSIYRGLFLLDALYSGILRSPEKSMFPKLFWKIGTHPEVDASKCTKCMKCVEACPVDAITKEIEIIPEKCRKVRCLRCFEVCPEGAIKVKGVTRPSKNFKN